LTVENKFEDDFSGGGRMMEITRETLLAALRSRNDIELRSASSDRRVTKVFFKAGHIYYKLTHYYLDSSRLSVDCFELDSKDDVDEEWETVSTGKTLNEVMAYLESTVLEGVPA
jgi:hypothetical protein